MASGVAVAARASPAPRARRVRDTLGRRASVPPGDVTSGERMRNVFGPPRAPRVAASAREGGDKSSVSRPRRGRARRVAAPPSGAFREDERGAGAAATTTAEPDPKSPAAVPNAASERNIRESEEAAEAAGASGGWWAWTKRWALGDSDEDSDEDAPPSAGGDDTRTSTGASAADAPEDDADRSFLLNRVPLPPWLKDQFAELVFPDVFPDAIELGLERKADAANARDASSRFEPRVDPTETPLRARADEERDDDDEAHAAHAFAEKNKNDAAASPRRFVASGSITVTREASETVETDHPSNMEAFAEALDDGGIVGDATVNKSGALAASVTRAAVDTLEDALAEVEARERARAEAKEQSTRRNDAKDESESADDAADVADGAGDWSTGADADEAASELKLALAVARRRAAEARDASVALGEAARDVAKAREAMKASSGSGLGLEYGAAGSAASASSKETDTQRRRRLRGALGAAGDRLLAASAASRAAAAAASASLRKVAFFDDDDADGSAAFGYPAARAAGGAAVKSSAVKTSGVNNASRARSRDASVSVSRDDSVTDDVFSSYDALSRKSRLTGSFEALELSGAVSRVAEWSVARVFKKNADKNVTASEKGKASASALGDAVAPALARVVAQSLEPSSPADLRRARVACGLAAWIYYLPTAHKSLAKFGLRMVASSMDATDTKKGAPATFAPANGDGAEREDVAGVPATGTERHSRDETFRDAETNARSYSDDRPSGVTRGIGLRPSPRCSVPGAQSLTARADEMARRAIDAADAAMEELARGARADSGTLADSVEAAREAARLAEAVSERLDALREEADGDEKSDAMTRADRSDRSDRSKEAKSVAADDLVRDVDGDVDDALGSASSSPTTSSASFASNAVASPSSSSRPPKRPLPVAYAVAADDEKGTLWISIEGSTSLASWQTNLTFQPVPFEDPRLDVRVHRGAYDAARIIFDEVEACVRAHVATHGANARVHITGHSIGGSLAMVLGLMLILRGAVEKKHVADVWTFGAPYVLCGGDELLRRLGLERSFIKSVAMGKDIVPRSFSCYYPEWARRALEMAPGSLRVDVEAQRSLLEEEMFYSPVGDMFLLQAMHGSAHPLLPPGPGLYQLAGDGLFDEIAAKVASETPSAEANDELAEADAESHWLDRRAGAGWGEWFGDHREDVADGFAADVASRRASASSNHAIRATNGSRSAKPPKPKPSLNRLACLTQHDAALTASLILGSVDTRDVEARGGDGNLSALLQEKGRDAARRVVLNTPHPLTVLSDPKAYGNAGSISRHHNPFNYLRALGKTRRVWENGSQPRRNGVADALGSRDEDE